MTYKAIVATAVLLLAACNNGGGANNATASANLAAPAPAPVDNRLEDVTPPPAPPLPDLEGARVLIGQIYMPYTRGEVPQQGGNVYTPELQRAIDRQSDDEAGLGFDPFCRCQDFENFRYTIQSVERRGNEGATARIGFNNFNEHHVVTLLLDYRGGHWLVADIREGQQSLLAGR
jgi:Protein of unknown function (DUF3828)